MDLAQSCENKRVSAARRRTIYLFRLAAGYVLLIVALAVGVTCEVASVFAWAVASDRNEFAAFAAVATLVISGGFGWRMFRVTIDGVSRMPYVPPVREQIAALAAESVLVRGSISPIGGEDNHLRASACAEQWRPDELLRSCDDEMP